MLKFNFLLHSFIACGLFLGCSTQTKPISSHIDIPQNYKEESHWKKATPNDNVARGAWWEMYQDPTLNNLMQELLISNLSIMKYEALYKQALALVESSQSALVPSLSVGASASKIQTSAGVGTAKVQKRSSDYKVPLQASWTIDLWGNTRRQVEAQTLSAEATLNDLEAAKLSVQILLAQSYFQFIALNTQEELLAKSLSAYNKSLEIAQNQHKVGIVTKKDVLTAQSQLKSVEAQKIDLGIQKAQLEHAIATLLGKTASSFNVPSNASKVATLPAIPYSLPSELLERRPDIAAAQRRMQQSNIQLGIAKDAWFPTLNLTASTGYESSLIPSLFSAPNLIWAVGGTLTQALFDGGLREANKKQAMGAYEVSIANYRQVVLSAFQQVEDALSTLDILDKEAKVQQEAVMLAQQVLDYNLEQYTQGIVNYTSVVVAQNSLLNSQIIANNLWSRQVLATLSLISALGGDFK